MNNISQKQKDFINQTTNSIGWDLVESMLREEFTSTPLDINTEGKSNEEIAREVAAREITAQKAESFIKKVHQISSKGDEMNLRSNYK